MRRYVRHPTDIPIFVRAVEPTPDSRSDCAMTSVSQGGFSCRVDAEVHVGCFVNIDIPSVSPSYHGTGEVVWCKPNGMGFEIGVRFTDSEEAFKSRMVQQICQIEHYKNLVYEREGRILDGNEAASEWIEKYASHFDQ